MWFVISCQGHAQPERTRARKARSTGRGWKPRRPACEGPLCGRHAADRAKNRGMPDGGHPEPGGCRTWTRAAEPLRRDRKSTRLNSSHVKISYAVFCLKKKKKKQQDKKNNSI